jgi:hypothetical protein
VHILRGIARKVQARAGRADDAAPPG